MTAGTYVLGSWSELSSTSCNIAINYLILTNYVTISYGGEHILSYVIAILHEVDDNSDQERMYPLSFIDS